MKFNRKTLNIILLTAAILLSGVAIWLATLPAADLKPQEAMSADQSNSETDTAKLVVNDALISPMPVSEKSKSAETTKSTTPSASASEKITVRSTDFYDVNPERLIANHPFRKEALKIINSHLEESDSISRRKILSYCEHLRAAYPTKDIDFIRQVFSDNALIIVGNVVKTGRKSDGGGDSKVSYAVRSKQAYLSRLAEVFKANKEIKVEFSDFNIMRHPSMKGIYGVTLRQKYSTDKYSDDGYLFLLWDFRNPSMPQIHVRTWQPHKIIAEGEERIDISDFNIE